MLNSIDYETYKDSVFDVLFSEVKTDSEPTAFILAGQPGSGKGYIKRAILEEYPNVNNYVQVDPDEFRPLHPFYTEYNQADDKTASERTHEDASRVAGEATDYTIQNKFNVIIDGTLKNSDKAETLIDKLKASGYKVIIYALCVEPIVSLTGCLERYFSQKEDFGYGRYVPIHIHNSAVNSMVISLMSIVLKAQADELIVLNREGEYLLELSLNILDDQGKTAVCDEIESLYIELGGRSLPLNQPFEFTVEDLMYISEIKSN
jgi:hypothetical protein